MYVHMFINIKKTNVKEFKHKTRLLSSLENSIGYGPLINTIYTFFLCLIKFNIKAWEYVVTKCCYSKVTLKYEAQTLRCGKIFSPCSQRW